MILTTFVDATPEGDVDEAGLNETLRTQMLMWAEGHEDGWWGYAMSFDKLMLSILWEIGWDTEAAAPAGPVTLSWYVGWPMLVPPYNPMDAGPSLRFRGIPE